MLGPARYAGRGWKLFPCNGKVPAIESWKSATAPPVQTIKQWLASGKNLGLPMAANGLVAVDVDVKGLDAWGQILAEHGEPPTLHALSGSGAGHHYIFRERAGASYRGKLAEGIDIKHHGYLIVSPSKHPETGLQYEWLNDENPAPLPEWMREKIEKPATEKSAAPAVTLGFDELKELIAKLKTKPLTYEQWVQCGMAIHSATKGSGMDLWLDLTSGVSYKEGDEALAIAKWATFRSDGAIGAGTLRHTLRSIEGVGGAADFDPAHTLNGEGWCVLSSGIIARVADDKSVTTYGNERFRTLMANRTDDNGHNMGKEWLQSEGRRQYRNIVFRPDADERDLNTWTTIPCEADRETEGLGDILMFIKDVVCGGHKARYDYLFSWFAQLVQQPHIKSTIVPVLIGQQGTGKGMLTDGLMGGILGKYYVRLDKPGVIMERFNVEQSRKFLTVMDESCANGKKELNNVIKSLTGNDTMTVEEKFGGRYTIENFSRYMVTSNDIDAVCVEESNRRFLIFEMAGDMKHLCGPLWQAIKYGKACQVFYGWLLDRDISHFNPHEFPACLDIVGSKTKVKSMGAVGEFWYDVLAYEPLPLWIDDWRLDRGLAYRRFCDMYPRYRTSQRWFWEHTESLIPKLRDTGKRIRSADFSGRVNHITVAEMRESFFKANRITMTDVGIADDEYLTTPLRPEDF